MKLRKMLSGHFNDSPSALLSFMVREDKLSKEEIKKMKQIIEKLA